MRRVLSSLVVVVALVGASSAFALDTKNFKAKDLEKDYKLAVFAPKGGVVGGEVLEDVNDVEHKKNAVYAVNSDIKKVVEFYTKDMGEPKVKDDGTGTVFYLFVKIDKENAKIRREVKLHVDPDNHTVQVSLTVREFSAAEDAN